MFLRRFPNIRTDVVGLLDEWAARFFEELDYVREGNNATKFAQQMEKELPQVMLAFTFMHLHVASDAASQARVGLGWVVLCCVVLSKGKIGTAEQGNCVCLPDCPCTLTFPCCTG